MKTKIRTNPVFFASDLALELGDAERVASATEDPRSVDLLTWNVFASLQRHRDPDWLAHRLQIFGGTDVRPPVRVSLWSGRDREPLLPPAPGYVATVRERAQRSGNDDPQAVAEFVRPVEIAVRIETPDVLCLVDTTLGSYPLGNGGRDRLIEVIDAGLDAARRVGKQLAVAAVYASGTTAAAEISARMAKLRRPETLAEELGHRQMVAPVILREVPWQQLLRVWESEADWLNLHGQPVKAFLAHCRELGLR